MAAGRWSVVAAATLALVAGAVPASAGAAHAKKDKHVVSRVPKLHRVVRGAAVRLDALRQDSEYRETFLRSFGGLTPENEMKMQALQPRRGVFDFAAGDALVAFAREHAKRVHGHALVWGLQTPLWLVDHGATDDLGLHLPPLSAPRLARAAGGGGALAPAGWSRAELLAIMTDHIDRVVRHFGSAVPEWDVVNEPLAPSGALADNVWRRDIGDDYVELALRAARAASPRAKLFINEYAVEGPSAKLEGLVALVRDLKARNVPLDGIGLQYHTHILGFHDEATLARTMRRLAALGVTVQITEMDVGTSLLAGDLEQRLTRQAAAYGAAARACNAVPACAAFTVWGVTDRTSWLGAAEMPLLFDAEYRPKPAYAAVRAAFAKRSVRNPRRTRGVVRASRHGRVRVAEAAGAA